MNNCCCAELVVDEGQQIELNVESDGGIEVGVAEQFVIGGGGNYQDKTVNITPTESAQSQTVRADVGYDALDEVEVNVAAIADDYVGSAVPRRASSSLTESGATITAPAGYYANQASKTIQTAQWEATATKSAVSNHAVTVTPTAQIINAGYRPVGTKNGTAVSVSASELVSGTKSITANGTGIDVTEYAAVDVAVPSGSPTLQNKTVYPSSSDQSITADVGYDGLGTVTAKAVTTTNLTAANIVSGVTVEVGDADDPDRVASVTGTATSGWTTDGIATNNEPNGTITLGNTVTALGAYAFAGKKITNIYGPEVLTLNASNEFKSCTSLVKAKFPKCTSVGTSANKYTFQSSSAQYIALPKLSGNLRANFAQGDASLKVVDAGVTGTIETKAMHSCTNFDTLILRKTSRVTLGAIDGIASGTKFKNGGAGGTIYIPKVLYDHLGDGTSDDYKAASNWSTVNGYGTITWAKLEGSVYESEDWLTI